MAETTETTETPKAAKPDGPAQLPQETVDLIWRSIRHWRTVGKPESARILSRCLDDNREPPIHLVNFTAIRPERDVPNLNLFPTEPPREGKDSTRKRWAEFAMAVADLDETVLEKLGRNSIIKLLEAKGIIDQVE